MFRSKCNEEMSLKSEETPPTLYANPMNVTAPTATTHLRFDLHQGTKLTSDYYSKINFNTLNLDFKFHFKLFFTHRLFFFVDVHD